MGKIHVSSKKYAFFMHYSFVHIYVPERVTNENWLLTDTCEESEIALLAR